MGDSFRRIAVSPSRSHLPYAPCSILYAMSLCEKTPNRTCVQLGVMTNKVTLYVTLTL